MAEVEATEAILLELTKNITQLTQEAMDSDPVISTIPKPKLLDILNSLVTNVIIFIYNQYCLIKKMLRYHYISGQAEFVSEWHSHLLQALQGSHYH